MLRREKQYGGTWLSWWIGRHSLTIGSRTRRWIGLRDYWTEIRKPSDLTVEHLAMMPYVRGSGQKFVNHLIISRTSRRSGKPITQSLQHNANRQPTLPHIYPVHSHEFTSRSSLDKTSEKMALLAQSPKARVILGLMTFGPDTNTGARITSLDEFNKCLDYFQQQGYNEVDTGISQAH